MTTVSTAQQLYETLSCIYLQYEKITRNDPHPACHIGFPSGCSSFPTGQLISCNNPLIIRIASGATIDLGDLPHDVFPLELSPGVVIEGDYDMFNINPLTGKSIGTRVIFPYLFEYGAEATTSLNNFNSSGPAAWCNEDIAAAFKLNDGCAIRKICLVGGNVNYKDNRFDRFWDRCNAGVLTERQEGLSYGILVQGNRCEISYCEIYGFPQAAIQVRDIVSLDEDGNYYPWQSPDCFDEAAEYAGYVNIHHNYIHHNKRRGFAYGIYVSAGGGKHCNTPADLQGNCVNPSNENNFYNFERPEEVAYIFNNIFLDNNQDVDGSGHRLSMVIENNTFGRHTAQNNIHLHNGNMWACNPMNETQNNPNHTIFGDVGCSQIMVINNVFYKEAENIDFVYPNINQCSPPNSDAPYQYAFPLIAMGGNYFNTSAAQVAANSTLLDWDIGQAYRNGYAKVQVQGIQHYNYLFNGPFPQGDDHLQFGDEIGMPDICDTAPFNVTSLTPIATIASVKETDFNNGIPSDNIDKIITEGETIYFDAHLCSDVHRNAPPSPGTSVIYMWKFHQESNDLEDEIRAGYSNTNPLNYIAYTFNKIGITTVTLIAVEIDNGSNGWRMSEIARQQITVAPAVASVYLSFWIKDSFTGREMTDLPPNNYGVDDTRTPSPGTNTAPTNMEKFASINGQTVWRDDIEGDEGWQHVKVFLNHGQPNSPFSAGTLTIGLRSLEPVDANRVKGAAIFVDNVSINKPNNGNLNALINGDFEMPVDYLTNNNPHSLVSLHAEGWLSGEFSWPQGQGVDPFVRPTPCGSTTFQYSNGGWELGEDEVRSGHWSYSGWLPSVWYNQTEPGLMYEGERVYKSLSQYYDINTPEKSKPVFLFKIVTNPTIAGTVTKVACLQNCNSEKTFEIMSTQGTTVYSRKFNSNSFEFIPPVSPGVYFAKLMINGKSQMQKFIVNQK